jgi:hypothetical protein
VVKYGGSRNCLVMKVAGELVPKITTMVKKAESEPAPTSAPTWMDGALTGFAFLSLCYPRLPFFFALSRP